MNVAPILTRRHWLLATCLFSVFVVYGSLVPLAYRACSFADAVSRYTEVMSQPPTFTSRSDWAANVLLFIPLGFLAAAATIVDRTARWPLLALVPFFAAFSGAIEFLQLWFPDRTTSCNDVIAETLGGIAGLVAWLLVGMPLTTRLRAMWANLDANDWAAKLLPVYGLLLVFAHGMPFDLSISPGEVWQKYQRGFDPEAVQSGAPIAGLVPAHALLPEKLLLCVVYFLPLGALLARLPSVQWRQDDAMLRVFGVGLCVALAIEGMQLFVLSAGCYLSDVLCGTLAVVVGWKLACQVRVLSVPFPMIVGIAWCLALAIVRVMPFEISTSERAFQWLPFADYYASNYLAAFNRILNVSVLWIPVGYFLGRRHPLVGLLIGTAVAAMLEMGQLFCTTHVASSSDVILGACGGVTGSLLYRYLPRTTSLPKPSPKPSAPAKIVFYSGLR